MKKGVLQNFIETLNKNELERIYKELGSAKKIAIRYGVSQQTVLRAMEFYGIEKKNLGNKKHFFNEDFFEIIDSEEKAYWLGFIFADGCVYKGTGSTYRLQINLKYGDISHLKKFQTSLGSDYKIQVKEVNNSMVAILKINSTKLCKDLINLGVIERKSLVCEFPKIKDEFIHHFIRGYFDGDGNITMTIGEKVSKSFNIIGGLPMISEIARHLGIENIYSLKRNEDIKNLDTGDTKKILNIHDYLYSDSNIYLTRKKRSFDIIYKTLKSLYDEKS